VPGRLVGGLVQSNLHRSQFSYCWYHTAWPLTKRWPIIKVSKFSVLKHEYPFTGLKTVKATTQSLVLKPKLSSAPAGARCPLPAWLPHPGGPAPAPFLAARSLRSKHFSSRTPTLRPGTAPPRRYYETLVFGLRPTEAANEGRVARRGVEFFYCVDVWQTTASTLRKPVEDCGPAKLLVGEDPILEKIWAAGPV